MEPFAARRAERGGGRRPPSGIPDYKDVFGGPPRHCGAAYSRGAAGDYAEIFGGVAGSCSIPFLDLLASAHGDPRAAGFDYGEIFGCSGSGEFAFPCEELFRVQRRKWAPSSDGSVPKGYVVNPNMMEGSEANPGCPEVENIKRSPKEQIFSEKHVPNSGLMEFGFSGCKMSFGGLEENLNDQEHRNLEFGGKGLFSHDKRCGSPKKKSSSFYGSEKDTNHGESVQILSPECATRSPLSDMQYKKVKVSSIASPVSEEVFESGRSHSPSSSYHSMSNEDVSGSDATFHGVPEGSLHSQPNQVPTLSTPPPKVISKKRHPRIKLYSNSKADIDEESSNGPMIDHLKHSGESNVRDSKKHGSFRDKAVDSGSAAAVAAAAMKEAMEQAQAKLKSAKELMERQRENVPIHKNYLKNNKNNSNGWKKDNIVPEITSLSAVVAWEDLLKEDEDIADLFVIKRQNVEGTAIAKDRHGAKEGVQPENGKLKVSTMSPDLKGIQGAWKIDSQLHEQLENDVKSRPEKGTSRDQHEAKDGVELENGKLKSSTKTHDLKEKQGEWKKDPLVNNDEKIRPAKEGVKLQNGEIKSSAIAHASKELQGERKTDIEPHESVKNGEKSRSAKELSRDHHESKEGSKFQNGKLKSSTISHDSKEIQGAWKTYKLYEPVTKDEKSGLVEGMLRDQHGATEGLKLENWKLKPSTITHDFKVEETEWKTDKQLCEVANNDEKSRLVKVVPRVENDVESFSTNMQLNNETVCSSDMAENSFEVKKNRKMWAINEIHEHTKKNEENTSAVKFPSREEEISEILTAIREAHEKVDTKNIVEDAYGANSQDDDTNRIGEVCNIRFSEAEATMDDTLDGVGFSSSLDCYKHMPLGEDTTVVHYDSDHEGYERNEDAGLEFFYGDNEIKSRNYMECGWGGSQDLSGVIELVMPLEGAYLAGVIKGDPENTAGLKALRHQFTSAGRETEYGNVNAEKLEESPEDAVFIEKLQVLPDGVGLSTNEESFEPRKVESRFIRGQANTKAVEKACQQGQNENEAEEVQVDSLQNLEDNKNPSPLKLEDCHEFKRDEEDHEHENMNFVNFRLNVDNYNEVSAPDLFRGQCEYLEASLPGKEVDQQRSVHQLHGQPFACEKINLDVTRRIEKEDKLERVRRLEREKEKDREREKDKLSVEKATREARQRLLDESRERAERAAVDRVTTETRQRALAEAQEKAEKASAEALEKARLRAERAAVERATSEARERAMERSMADRASLDSREQRTGRFNTSSRDRRKNDDEAGDNARVSDKRDTATKIKSNSPDVSINSKFRGTGSSNSSQKHTEANNSHKVSNIKSEGIESESALRCKARLERHQRTVERAAKALAEKNMRDILAQREQTERNRLAESLDAEIRRWSTGKQGNLRALLSTLQYILRPDSGWQPVPLTDIVTAVAVKKAYRKATLCVHPDKLQQRGASIQQKYICEKVFDLLKEAWNRFNSEER